MLLDEKLKAMHFSGRNMVGYDNEQTSHLGVASAVARGDGDFGLGIERITTQVGNMEFIPLQKEWYDMVFLAEQIEEAPFSTILDYISSSKFMREISQIGDYDFSQTGRILKRG